MRSPDDLAHEFGIARQTARKWSKQHELDSGVRKDGLTSEERAELLKLRRENKQLKIEREILSKARGLVRSVDRSDTEEIFRFVKSNQATYRLSTLSRLLGVSTSGYYAWSSRPPSPRALSDMILGDRIEALWRGSRET